MKCWKCGKENAQYKRDYTRLSDYAFIKISLNLEHQRCYCKECYESTIDERKRESELYIRLKKKRMLETAIDKMEKQGADLYAYHEAIETIREYFQENLDRFDSSEEVMSAIVLIHNHIHIKPQYKVGKYQVDFLLPNERIVLEIDGERHKHRKSYDNKRDAEIKAILGDDYEIIRIPTEHIDKNVSRIVKAIDSVIDYRITGRVNWRKV